MLDLVVLLSEQFREVECMDFYRDVFPVGSFEEKGIYEKGKYNGVAVSIHPGDDLVKRFLITDDLQELKQLMGTNDFCLMSPISYVGRSRKSANARFMYALAIDLDGMETVSYTHLTLPTSDLV